MELRLSLFGIKRSIDLSRFARYRNAAVVLASALLVIPLTVFLLRPAAVPDLAHGNVSGAQALMTGWAKGDLIVLVRHVERCDHSSAPCLVGNDGITERSRRVAENLGAQFKHLGLGKVDIYNSPIQRTAQTANFMFNKVGAGEDWLISCKGTMLRDALAHKVAGRNMILVTHSECMDQLEKELHLPTSTPGLRGLSVYLRRIATGSAHAWLYRSIGLADGDAPLNFTIPLNQD